MNLVDLIVNFNYTLFSRRSRLKNRLLSPIRVLTRKVANFCLPYYLNTRKISQKPKSYCDVIISLTSFPMRIGSLWQVIVCLLNQTYRPKKILLWLSKQQFGNNNELPESLVSLIGDVFEIRWVDGDIRSHKKHYYVSKEFPDELIFFVDDDIYYPTTMLERVMKAHEKHPDAVICQYGYKMLYDDKCSLKPYNTWEKVFRDTSEPDLFFGSGGGTLIRASSLYSDLTKAELFTQLTPIADDIWLNAMVRLADIPIVMIKTGHILPVLNKTDEKLASENRGKNKNDEQLERVSYYYKTNLGIDPFAKKCEGK